MEMPAWSVGVGRVKNQNGGSAECKCGQVFKEF